jgi:membrane protease YdiL (CAAX protease family)
MAMADQQPFFTRTGLYLWLAGVFGAICVLPYAVELAPAAFDAAAQQLGIPTSAVIGISIAQSALLLAFATFTGLWAARKLGLGAPLVDALIRKEALPHSSGRIAVRAIVLGVAAALLILILDWLVFSAVAESLEDEAQLHVAPWKGLLASFYGGIAEELLLRLFMLSVVALGIRYVFGLVSKSQNSSGLSWTVFWIANISAAVLFGLGHLPATAELLPLTPLVVARAIILNGAIGLVAGFLYWRRGIEMAMICHFFADLVLHVVFPLLS